MMLAGYSGDRTMKGQRRTMKAAPRASAARISDAKVAEAVEAVCDELGISDREGRALIARRVEEAYARGPRQPLNLVNAGLVAAIASTPSCV
jgi:hypothetical protein